MLTSRYMTSVKNLPAILAKIVEGAPPAKFTLAHLKGIGFKSSNDEGVLPLLKDLGFLAADGTPTKRYQDYRDRSRSRAVLGQAIKEAYEDLFHINEKLSENDRPAIEGRFKSVHNATDEVAKRQAMTFLALLKLGDTSAATKTAPAAPAEKSSDQEGFKGSGNALPLTFGGLRYNIEIHLPATKEVEVYNAIFKSLREHLIDE